MVIITLYCHCILYRFQNVYELPYNSTIKSVYSTSNTLQLRECFNISTQYKDFNLSINSKADDDQEIPKGCDHNANLVIATLMNILMMVMVALMVVILTTMVLITIIIYS